MNLRPALLLGFAMQLTPAQIIIEPVITTLNSNDVEQLLVTNVGAPLGFKYTGVETDSKTPNFVIVMPQSGTTPATINVGINASVLPQLGPNGFYTLKIDFTSVGQTPPTTGVAVISVSIPPEPPPSITAVLNAASLQPALSPGELVTIYGTHLTGPTESTSYGDTGNYPTSVASTSVTFNGIAASLVYISPGQINAIVPFALAGQTSAQVVVQRFNLTSATFTLPLQDTAPGIFTATQNGAGQGAILQQGPDRQFTYNSSANPAPRGAALEIFATGAGVWTPPAQSDVFLLPFDFRTQPVSVTIGGQPAKLLYAGTQGTQSIWSLLQVNAIVPDGVGSGPQPVVLKIGSHDNSQQNVTVWVQ